MGPPMLASRTGRCSAGAERGALSATERADSDRASQLLGWTGDAKSAWEELTSELRRRLLAVAGRFLRDRSDLDAEDVVGDVLERLHARKGWLEPVAAGLRPLVPTVIVAVQNEALSRLRRPRVPTLTDGYEPAGRAASSGEASVRRRARALQGVLRRFGQGLPTGQRAVLLLDARLLVARVARTGAAGTTEPPSVLAARLFPYDAAEAGLVPLAGGPSLLEGWCALVSVVDEPAAKLGDAQLAGVMGVTVARLTKWRERAKTALLEVAPEVAELAPAWFRRGKA